MQRGSCLSKSLNGRAGSGDTGNVANTTQPSRASVLVVTNESMMMNGINIMSGCYTCAICVITCEYNSCNKRRVGKKGSQIVVVENPGHSTGMGNRVVDNQLLNELVLQETSHQTSITILPLPDFSAVDPEEFVEVIACLWFLSWHALCSNFSRTCSGGGCVDAEPPAHLACNFCR